MIDSVTSASWNEAKRAFWQVVKACLIEFHGFSEMKAEQRSTDLRKRIEAIPREHLTGPHDKVPGGLIDLFYHHEPFYVACDIAGNELDPAEYDAKYGDMLEKYGW